MLFSPTYISPSYWIINIPLHSASAGLFLFFKILIAFIIWSWIVVRNSFQRLKLFIWVWMIIWWSAKTLLFTNEAFLSKERMRHIKQIFWTNIQPCGIIGAKHVNLNRLWLPSLQRELKLLPWTVVFPSFELD